VKGEKGKENNGGRNLGMMKKRKQKWAQIDGAMEGDNLKKAMERRKKALDRHDKKMQQEIQQQREVSPEETSVAIPSLSQKESIAARMARGSFEIKEFANKHESVTFFDATSIFAEDVGDGGHHLDNNLISPHGNSSELGFVVWEGRIMGRFVCVFRQLSSRGCL
jgi:seryl-tRNA synthetase